MKTILKQIAVKASLLIKKYKRILIKSKSKQLISIKYFCLKKIKSKKAIHILSL